MRVSPWFAGAPGQAPAISSVMGDQGLRRFPCGMTPIRPLAKGEGRSIWLARDEQLHRLVVLKRLAVSTSEGVSSGAGESLVASVSHPGLAQLYAVSSAGTVRWLVCEWIDGRALLASQRLWRPIDVIAVLGDLCCAVRALSDANICHADISPGNIVIDVMGATRLVDFSLASEIGARACGAGTPGFAAPEVRDTTALTVTTDAWSLGAVAVWMLSGATPQRMRDATGKSLVTLPSCWRATTVPGLIRDLVEAVLRESPESRPSLTELSDALEAATTLLGGDNRERLRCYAAEVDYQSR